MTAESTRVAKAFRPHQFSQASGHSSPELAVVGQFTEKKVQVNKRNKKGDIYMIDFMKSSDSLKDSQPSLENFINAGKRL